MRRKDREITDFDAIVAIMQQCQVCRLALNDGTYPYIVPLNFGITAENGTVTLYFHCANSGTKLDLIAADPHAAFEMDCEPILASQREVGECTMSYKSVIGQGIISMVEESTEKLKALNVLVDHYHPEGFAWNPVHLPVTTVFKLTVEGMTAKYRPMPKG